MRCYNDILREVPEDRISIAMIVHSMAEQVCSHYGRGRIFKVWGPKNGPYIVYQDFPVQWNPQ
jgi:hypothetical protein